MAKAYQQILRGHRSSERGIRYRILKGSVVDDLRRKAARIVAGRDDLVDAEIPELRRTIFATEGVKAMLVAVTKDRVPRPPLPPKQPGPKNADGSDGPEIQPPPAEPTLVDDALWQPLDLATLTQAGPFTLEYDDESGAGLFTAQDLHYLRALFSINHEVSALDAEAVAKKEQTVSTG
jgi:hypothetical protein